MALDSTKSLEIIEIMENYISKIRPKPEIRNHLDIGYELIDQSIVLQEIRPKWDDPSLIMRIGYAKATFVQRTSCWKIHWKRADLKWHVYSPQPIVSELTDFLHL
jgi:hypothetical protein